MCVDDKSAGTRECVEDASEYVNDASECVDDASECVDDATRGRVSVSYLIVSWYKSANFGVNDLSGTNPAEFW